MKNNNGHVRLGSPIVHVESHLGQNSVSARFSVLRNVVSFLWKNDLLSQFRKILCAVGFFSRYHS